MKRLGAYLRRALQTTVIGSLLLSALAACERNVSVDAAEPISVDRNTSATPARSCTTATRIDEDCDGYGPGSPLGPDADDRDPAANTVASVEAKYGGITSGADVATNLRAFFAAARGYQIGDIFFVSPSGDNVTGVPNDIDRPFRYLGYTAGIKGHPSLGPGDLILYRGGDYSTNLGGNSKDQIDVQYGMPVGTAALPIIFASFPGELAAFSGNQEGISGANTTLKDLHYVFDTFRIGNPAATTSGNGIVLTGAREVTWRYIEIYRKGSAGMRIMSYVNWPAVQIPLKNILFENSIVAQIDGALGTATHNIYWGHAVPKSFNNPATGCTVRNVISRGNSVSYDGMQFNGHFENWRVENSQFHSASGWGFSVINGPSRGRFVNNLVFNNNTAGLKIGKYVGFVGNNTPNGEATVDENLFAHNTIWVGDLFNGNGPNDGRDPSAWNAIYFYTEAPCKTNPFDGGMTCPDLTRFYSGNIVQNNILVSHAASVLRADQIGHLQHNVFLNNLFFKLDGGSNIAADYPVTRSWNLAQLEADPSMAASGNLFGDPLFADASATYATSPTLFNFSLLPNSPAKGAGLLLQAVKSDARGAPRGDLPSIGAYE